MAEYLEVDPTLVRILWILSAFFGGFTILLYVILAFVIPLEPGTMPGPASWQPAGPAWGGWPRLAGAAMGGVVICGGGTLSPPSGLGATASIPGGVRGQDRSGHRPREDTRGPRMVWREDSRELYPLGG